MFLLVSKQLQVGKFSQFRIHLNLKNSPVSINRDGTMSSGDRFLFTRKHMLDLTKKDFITVMLIFFFLESPKVLEKND